MAVGTQFYSLILNLAASAAQPEITQALKSRGDDVIQTSNGLCVRSTLSLSDLEALIGDLAAAGVKIEPVDLSSRDELPPDVQAFIGA